MAKAKGTTLVPVVRFLRSNRERAQEILPPELQHYLHERIQEPMWYPEEDLQGLLEALLRLLPGPREEALSMMGATAAREHFEGVYAHLKGSDNVWKPNRVFALWASQHDTGTYLVEPREDGDVMMIVRDFGLPSATMCGIFAGYFAEALRIAGATGVEATKEECVLRGDPQCSWRMTRS